MKFTDGNWMMQPGVRALSPSMAYEAEAEHDSLVVHAPLFPIHGRWSMLDGPLVTVRYSAPCEDVIRVNISHFLGERERSPQFEVNESVGFNPCVSAGDQSLCLRSGRLSVCIPDRKRWAVDFAADGRILTRSGERSMAMVEKAGDGVHMREQLDLGVGEYVYGLGERFTPFIKNGQTVDTWNRDGGTGSEQAYKNVPFYMTNRGYGVFVNQPENVSFEIASERVSKVQFSVKGNSLEYFVIYGPTPKEVLEMYTALTGRPALPPAWSFGLWLTTSFTTSYDEATVTEFIQGMEDRDLPLSVFHFDCFWMREFHWCDFKWDERVFPDPPAMLSRLKARGLKVCVWINPYIAERSRLFADGVSNGYFLKRADGSVWQTDQWQPGMAIVDFTNPAACEWYASKLKALLDMGVDAFKTDFGERIPTDVVYFDGSDPYKQHNYYSYDYNKVVFDLLVRERGEGDAVLFARSGTVGSQKLPVHWGGDCNSTFESMAESLRGGLSLCLSGFGFWSHDIGGFEGTPDPTVYKRWIAFGMLSSHSRLHGSTSYRVPWVYDDEAVDTLRFFTKLKCRLMPTIFQAAVEAHESGTPVMRAMLVEFPEDPTCAYLDRQYMLGESLLVAPVMSGDGFVEYYVPEGAWTNYLTGDVVLGPVWRRENHGFLSVPILVRPNTVLAVGNVDYKPDYDYHEGVTFEIYEISDGASLVVTVPAQFGTRALSLDVTRKGNSLSASASGIVGSWRLLLVNAVASVVYGNASSSVIARGSLIEPAEGVTAVELTMKNTRK
ncbi:MAG TPA: alpha-xylosidase [Capsulimonadaceae bacterium]|jgi:alpha-D-xyloside xylohydrolase